MLFSKVHKFEPLAVAEKILAISDIANNTETPFMDDLVTILSCILDGCVERDDKNGTNLRNFKVLAWHDLALRYATIDADTKVLRDTLLLGGQK